MLDLEKLKKVIRSIVAVRDDEIGCSDCFDDMDRFVELVLEGKSGDEALPLVKHHLELCGDCREEYEVLLEALRAVE
jgi:hypothetical protein